MLDWDPDKRWSIEAVIASKVFNHIDRSQIDFRITRGLKSTPNNLINLIDSQQNGDQYDWL